MPLHNGSTRDDLPQYDNPNKQEAVRFLAANVEEQQLIDGMEDVDRVEAWLQVVDRFEGKEGVGDALRERRTQLLDELDQQAAFEPASEIEANQEAVADGGAEVVDKPDDDTDDDQDVTEYADAAERESMYQEARKVAKMYESVAKVEEKLQEEHQRDQRRPHVIDALEDHLQEVGE